MALVVMTPRVRKAALLAHVTLSVGWMGAVAAYFALAWSGLKDKDAEMARAAYLSMEFIGWAVIVPLSLSTLFSGFYSVLGAICALFFKSRTFSVQCSTN